MFDRFALLERAEAILKSHPEVASCDIHTAAILGDDAAVRKDAALIYDRARGGNKVRGPGWVRKGRDEDFPGKDLFLDIGVKDDPGVAGDQSGRDRDTLEQSH